jgi:outer membrane biosynthesis protein TonB
MMMRALIAPLVLLFVSSTGWAAEQLPPTADAAQAMAPSPDDELAGTTAPKLLKGHLHYWDLPEDLNKPGMDLSVIVNYAVGLDGKSSDCKIDRSSGQPELDNLTCKMIEHRFRYSPAKDVDGHNMAARIIETHRWRPYQPGS